MSQFQKESPEYVPVPEEPPMEVVQEVLEQVSRRLLTDSDLDSSFSFLKIPTSLATFFHSLLGHSVGEVMLRDRQDDGDILQQHWPLFLRSTGNCGLTVEEGKVLDQLRNLTNLVTTMSSQIQGLRQQGEKIRALKTDCRCYDSCTRFGSRRPYARTYIRSHRPQTPMRN
ncbi:Hypothetical predicted protein [Mytilus galloprovincialis]|uniref:Uncharacterized protein n=1 Tax=Mytilus galloprovincialis TaxID=29158 RepID=A0A8B6G6K8_MYTGA|nr:Hypothetical predicted protein [Mytilus galloprovincialis]